MSKNHKIGLIHIAEPERLALVIDLLDVLAKMRKSAKVVGTELVLNRE